MIKRIAAFYSIFAGISIMGMWCMILLSSTIPEGPVEMSFHLFSEFLMAVLLLIGGIGMLKGIAYGRKLFLVSNGMLIYSVLNAAGYYGQSSNYAMTGMFMVFFAVSTVLLIICLARQEIF